MALIASVIPKGTMYKFCDSLLKVLKSEPPEAFVCKRKGPKCVSWT